MEDFEFFFTGLVLYSLMARNTFAQEIGKFYVCVSWKEVERTEDEITLP